MYYEIKWNNESEEKSFNVDVIATYILTNWLIKMSKNTFNQNFEWNKQHQTACCILNIQKKIQTCHNKLHFVTFQHISQFSRNEKNLKTKQNLTNHTLKVNHSINFITKNDKTYFILSVSKYTIYAYSWHDIIHVNTYSTFQVCCTLLVFT